MGEWVQSGGQSHGILVGSNGEFHRAPGGDGNIDFASPTTASGPPPAHLTDIDPNIHSELSSRLLEGLDPFLTNEQVLQRRYGENFDSRESLSVLGHRADDVYYLGSPNIEDYTHRLETFIDVGLPASMRKEAKQSLEEYLGAYTEKKEDSGGSSHLPKGLGEDKAHKTIWQTDKNQDRLYSDAVNSWKDNGEGWTWKFMNDGEALGYVKRRLGTSRIAEVYNSLPNGILHSDMLRYLLMYVEGGIYSDVDTKRLKEISRWGSGANDFQDGEGWMPAGMNGGESLPGPSVILGVEADVGDREDWYEWWARPLQIAQWTLSSTPLHPIYLDVLLQITRQSAYAYDWQEQKPARVKALREAGYGEEADKLEHATISSEPKEGGPLGIIHWTGPGVWTDAVLRYLDLKYGLSWNILKNLQEPLRIGEITILPSTGFSPGVGLHGAQGAFHHEAMVEHQFAGTWKDND